jgi:hypothetical protein
MRSVLSFVALLAFAEVLLAVEKSNEVDTLSLNNDNNYVIFKYEGKQAVVHDNYMIELEEPAGLEVVDFEHAGEQYSIYDNGILLGNTSKVNVDQNAFAETPQDAVKDGRFSVGVFKLAKGNHKITFKVASPYVSGSAAIRLLKHTEMLWEEHTAAKNLYKREDSATNPMPTTVSSLVTETVTVFANFTDFATMPFFASRPLKVTCVDKRVDTRGVSTDLIFMFIIEDSDITFYRTQRVFQDLILVAESEKACEGLPRCVSLDERFTYLQLPDKVFRTLKLINDKFSGWTSISKMDDDAMVDIDSLRDVFPIHPTIYLGLPGFNDFTTKYAIAFALGHFYTLGKSVVKCILSHKDEFYGLNIWQEDTAIGYVATTICGYKYVDVTGTNLIWHKRYYEHKNKKCILSGPSRYANITLYT